MFLMFKINKTSWTPSVSNYCFHTINSDCTALRFIQTGYPKIFSKIEHIRIDSTMICLIQ